jgi:hypothetical protein
MAIDPIQRPAGDRDAAEAIFSLPHAAMAVYSGDRPRRPSIGQNH